MILNNLFVSTVNRKGISSADTSGDGEFLKERKFVYSFALMDLSTRMYVGYAVSVKSEMDAYHKALEMISNMHIDLKSIRLGQILLGTEHT